MQWTDEGIIIGVKRHGEANAILELMTRGHGRHLGLVRGGFGSRLRPVVQPGNSVNAVWRARLDEHLGNYTIEGVHLRAAALFATSHAMFGVMHLGALLRLLPERDPHAALYAALDAILNDIGNLAAAAPMMARFELQLIAELGFGLDLQQCASTGSTQDLVYVSPKSGRAVSRSAGEPWREKLLPLPSFLQDSGVTPTPDEIADAFALTGYFLARHALEPRGLAFTDARSHFIAAVVRHMPSVA